MKKSMINNNIKKSFYALVAVFLIVIIYILFILIFENDEILENPYNQKNKKDQAFNNYYCLNEIECSEIEVLYE